jgi:hypothetical protein
MPTNQPRARYYSIRLRILLFAGLALVFTTAAFTWLSLRQLDERQGLALVEQQGRSAELARRLFQQQSARLQSLGTWSPICPACAPACAGWMSARWKVCLTLSGQT